jgi:hypothetical protein
MPRVKRPPRARCIGIIAQPNGFVADWIASRLRGAEGPHVKNEDLPDYFPDQVDERKRADASRVGRIPADDGNKRG